ncbi:MAG: hypothetical protein [Podoviridae sp. ctQNx1]|nr:MAG: hypothetical protein [Podoviridae sp. ctQNx1]UOF78152.1 hypothetical protein [Caudoviricetes sp.]
MKQISLSTLRDATKQEVFEFIVTHLLTQFEKSSVGIYCRYRNDSGLSCAAGCLMNNKEYQATFEGRAWVNLVNSSLVPKEHTVLIQSMQLIHDNYLPHTWRSKLEEFAERNGLSADFMEDL